MTPNFVVDFKAADDNDTTKKIVGGLAVLGLTAFAIKKLWSGKNKKRNIYLREMDHLSVIHKLSY